jgi:hypothetical protein
MSEQQAAQDTPKAAGSSEVTTPVVEPVNATQSQEPAKTASANSGEPAKTEIASEKKEEVAAPKEYTLKLPEDSPLDDGAVERIAAKAKERGLTTEQAQELLNHESEAISSYAKAQSEAFKQAVDGWKSTIENDKELGGADYAKNAELAKRVVDRFATEDFKKALNETGFGNHPELFRVFFKIGKAMAEDQLVMPGAQQAPKQRSVEDLLYGNNNNNN